ncbi:MAG: AsmA family protein, partial [Rickettsiales bacterium]|nr:AsmA family protein [Rickettsiales bacterium]
MVLRRRKRTTLRIWTRIIFVFFMGALVAVAVAVHQLDVNSLKPNIVRALENSTGLPVEIAGDMSWKLSLRPIIKIKDIRVKGKSWAKHKYAVSIPEMLVQINLVSLLRNSPTIQSVKLVRPTVNIEENSKGDLSVEIRRRREIRIPEALVETEFPIDLDFGIGSLELDRPQIFFISKDAVESWMPDRIKLSLQGKTGAMDFAGSIAKGAARYPFSVSFSKFDGVRKAYPIRLAIAGDVIPMTVDLSLDADKIPTDVALKGRILDLPLFGKSIGFDLPRTARANIVLEAGLRKKSLSVKKLRLQSDKSEVSISGQYGFAGK